MSATDRAPLQTEILRHFSDPDAVADYVQGPPRFVPGFDALHGMTSIVLAERAPEDARVLVLGAGGGLEIRALAKAHPGWRFLGIDPSAAMLDLAARTLAPMLDRVELVQGYIEDAPLGPFDAATCLLTLHFLEPSTRLATLRGIRTRLRPGAPFVAAHCSFPQDDRSVWLDRYVAFAIASGADPEQAAGARKAIGAGLATLTPDQDEALMGEAGFADVAMFYAAFTWRGWIAVA